jgi:hypothetical protein
VTNDPADVLDALTSAYKDTVEAIRAMPDRKQAFDVATKLGEIVTDQFRRETGQLRAEIAALIYKDEALSLAGLANRVGISRGRAQDLIEAHRATSPREDPQP